MRRAAQHILRKKFEDSELGRAAGFGIAIALPRTDERHNGEFLISRQNRVDKPESTDQSRQMESAKGEDKTKVASCSGARQRVGGQSERKGSKEA